MLVPSLFPQTIWWLTPTSSPEYVQFIRKHRLQYNLDSNWSGNGGERLLSFKSVNGIPNSWIITARITQSMPTYHTQELNRNTTFNITRRERNWGGWKMKMGFRNQNMLTRTQSEKNQQNRKPWAWSRIHQLHPTPTPARTKFWQDINKSNKDSRKNRTLFLCFSSNVYRSVPEFIWNLELSLIRPIR